MEQQKELNHNAGKLKKSVQEIEQDIQALKDLQYNYDVKRKALESQAEFDTKGQTPKDTQLDEDLEQMFTGLIIKREVVMKEIANALTLADQIQSTLISEELPQWKKRQQMACIGGPYNICLDNLRNWFTVLAECLQQICQQLKKVEDLVQKFTCSNDSLNLERAKLDEKAHSLFKTLILNSLVVEKQPYMPTHPRKPLIIKSGVRFSVKISLLVRLPELNCQPKVTVSIDKGFSEMDTLKRFAQLNVFGTNRKSMNLEESSGCLAAHFPYLTLSKKRLINRSQSPFVLYEELHLLCIDTQLVLPDQCIDLSITSLPVVFLTPVSRCISFAWGSILWYNMLCSEPHNLTFFLNPPPVKWDQLSEVINWQFSSTTKRVLNSDQLKTLADKFLGHEAQGDPERLIHHSTFCKTAVGCGGSLRQWIYEHLELVNKYVLNIWNDGYIMGFLSQESADALLRDKAPGTFLLRFSEKNQDGGITITWVQESQDGEPVIHSTEPYTKMDMNKTSLPNIIRDYRVTDGGKDHVNPLIYLYPDTPRDVAFGRYYTSESEAQGGTNENLNEDHGLDMIKCALLNSSDLKDFSYGKSTQDTT